MWRLLIAGVLALVGMAVVYLGSEEQQVPITGREQRVALSDKQQQELGLEVYRQTLEQQRGQRTLVESGPKFDRVARVAQRISDAAAKHKPRFEWEFSLVRSDQINAFCLPGGKIVVYTGILEVAKNDAQLAAVLGHEVAHAVAEHGAERIYRQRLTDTAVAAASGALANDPFEFQRVASLLGAAASVGLQLPWGRAQESESDRIGLIYMAQAGYDPRQSIAFWERMGEASRGKQPPEYLSTHPSHGTRIRQLKRWMPEAMREYDKASSEPAQP